LKFAIIIILAGAALYYWWRLRRLCRGIDSLADTLREKPVAAVRNVPPIASQSLLRRLSTAALDTVTEAHLVRDSEKRQREFLEALLNEIKDAIFILDGNREVRFLNEAARQLFPSDQPYTARAFLDICRDHRIYDTLQLAEEVGSKVSDTVVLRIPGADNHRIREINLLVEAEPLSFAETVNGGGSWVLMRDITSQLETEQIRRDFVANASHELRTPLSILNGYLESMDDADVDLNQATYRRAVRTMRKHGERIARIVDDMLTISKLEKASSLLTHEPFDLRDSLEEMVSQLMPLIEQNHARLEIAADSRDSWELVGDRYYWDQIFFNLIENALKQNREPGLKITITFSLENGRYLLEIADDGIGIPAADIPLVFKRFYRVQKHHAQNQIKGTGLGLSIVKRAVEAHHGSITVASRPGVKTAFTITVPQNSLHPANQSASRDESGGEAES